MRTSMASTLRRARLRVHDATAVPVHPWPAGTPIADLPRRGLARCWRGSAHHVCQSVAVATTLSPSRVASRARITANTSSSHRRRRPVSARTALTMPRTVHHDSPPPVNPARVAHMSARRSEAGSRYLMGSSCLSRCLPRCADGVRVAARMKANQRLPWWRRARASRVAPTAFAGNPQGPLRRSA